MRICFKQFSQMLNCFFYENHIDISVHILYIYLYTVYAQICFCINVSLEKQNRMRQAWKGELDMVKFENVDKYLGEFHLQDLSFELPKGYIMGLIGENGAGKTSLLNLILGLYQPNRGTVQIFGKNYVDDEREIRNDISYVLTDGDLFVADMKLIENADMFGKYYDSYNRELLCENCRRFSLDVQKKWRKISKGEKLKFQFAFALSHGAKLLVLDEPTANFDPEFREQFLRMITEFVSDGEHSVILATHQLQDLDQVADYLMFLHHGEMIFFMDKETLTDKFRIVKGEPYKINLLKPERMVYKETGGYGASAMIRHRKIDTYDPMLTVSIPTVEELLYYLIKNDKPKEIFRKMQGGK